MAATDTAADYRARANQLLAPSDGMNTPSDKQLRKAEVLAQLAVSASISEATAAGTDLPLPAAIHHSH
ncbi:hypothetical protein [Streptomyces chartreusis]|uniref:hypothetical protein n=1 Tax=Streptomyces chartreusis TaxID=1969 RepID=UPI0037DC13A6|nr:hypothetical protein OG938_48215 [Streptomyces chartreusis]WTA33881.1 hypothetical protein OIA45_48580 [Streptomyces chartreusis]